MQCDRCAGETFTKAGRDRLGRQLWRCQACGRRLTARSASAFSDPVEQRHAKALLAGERCVPEHRS